MAQVNAPSRQFTTQRQLPDRFGDSTSLHDAAPSTTYNIFGGSPIFNITINDVFGEHNDGNNPQKPSSFEPERKTGPMRDHGPGTHSKRQRSLEVPPKRTKRQAAFEKMRVFLAKRGIHKTTLSAQVHALSDVYLELAAENRVLKEMTSTVQTPK